MVEKIGLVGEKIRGRKVDVKNADQKINGKNCTSL